MLDPPPSPDPQTASPSLADPFEVGGWRVVPMENRLVRGDDVRQLEPKVMEVLALLGSRPGETVSKDTFMAEVWTGTVVTDDVLARCIFELRKALGDNARDPDFIETIRKRGYRLIAPVSAVGPEPAIEPPAFSGDGVALGTPAPALRSPALERLPTRTRPGVWALWIGGALALGAVAAGALRQQGADVRPLGARPITSFPGEERGPALSPDGQRVAFAWDGGTSGPEGRQFDLYVQPVDGGALVRLTNHPADEVGPAWSPDGARVAFAQCGPGGCSILTTAADGRGAATSLLAYDPSSPVPSLHVQDLAWSPDGRTLAFSARRGGTGAFALHLLRLDGSVPRRLTAPASTYPGDLDPAFSPDGRLLAFVRTSLDGRQDVCVVPVEGGAVRRLAREQKGVTGLDWTASGREVVYAANRDGAAGLWRVRAAGGTPRWVALGADGGEVAEPSVARAGRGVTFSRRLVRSHLVEVGSGVERVLFPSTRSDALPSLSPDGRLAFVSTRSGSHEIWTASPDGATPRPLTSFGGARVSSPQWSPSGRAVVFSARPDGPADLYLVRPGEAPRRLTDAAGDEVAPAWSRDGGHVYFASNRSGTWQIYRQPLGGRDARPVTLHGGVAAAEVAGPAASGASGGLVVVRPDRRGLWVLPLRPDGLPDEGRASRLPVALAPADGANWTAAGGAVYAVERRFDGRSRVVRVDLGTRQRTTLAVVEGVPERSGLAVSTDGARVYLTREERADSDVILVESFR